MKGNSGKMAYVCLGFSHETAPLKLRERLNLEPDMLSARFSDFVLLSTCNRIEIYTTTKSASSLHQNGDTAYELLKAFSKHCQIDIHTLNRYASLYFDTEAAQHLFHVAAGLKSQIVGEPEILGQVSRAFKSAEREHRLNDSLRGLFRHAVKVGRRARTETKIGHHSCSFATISLKLAGEHLGELSNTNVLLVGAGSIASGFIKQLRHAKHVDIVSRSLGPARRMAAKVDGQAFESDRLDEKLADADLVVTSTSSKQALIDSNRLGSVMRKRSGRPLLIIDLAVPRNVDPSVDQLAGVKRFDIEDLNSVIQQSLEKRLREIPSVERILFEELAMFVSQPAKIRGGRGHWLDRLQDIRIAELKKLQDDSKLEHRVCNLMDQFSRDLIERIFEEFSRTAGELEQGIDGSENELNEECIGPFLSFDFEPPFRWGLESDSNPAD